MKIKLLIIPVFVLLVMSAHSQTWVSGYNGTGNGDDQVTAICSDASGNVYVTGFSTGTTTGYDILTIKYNFLGDTVWTRRYNGTGNGEDKAFAIVIDETDYIYVSGFITGSGNNQEDMVVIKYSPSGSQVWARTYNSGSGNSDKAFGLAVDVSTYDNTGPHIYITGYSKSGNNYDFRTLKYNNDGTLDWSKYYNGGTNTDDQALGIAVDAAGDIIVTGFSQTSSSASYDYYTIKYSFDGTVIWSKRFNGTSNGNDRAFGLVVDALKNVIVTGYSANISNGNPSTYDIATIKYDKNGITEWTKVFNGNENAEDRPFGIAVDAANNVYVTGITLRTATSNDIVTIKYSSTGGQSWTSFYNSASNNADQAYGLALSPNGNYIYVIGSSLAGQNETPVLLKYNSNGTLAQSVLYPAIGRATCLSVSNLNNLFIGGYQQVNSDEMALNNDFISMEFEGGLINIVGISGNNNEIPNQYKLFQNYPNPFNPVTTVKMQLPQTGLAKLSVYDISGKEVAVLINRQLAAGTYEITFDAGSLASGIYFYKLFAGDYTDTKKMTLVK